MRNDKLLPELIKNLCDEKEMSYYNLASASGVPITTIMNIVHGITKNPGIFTILKLCDGLDISVHDLIEKMEDPDGIE